MNSYKKALKDKMGGFFKQQADFIKSWSFKLRSRIGANLHSSRAPQTSCDPTQ